VKKPIDVAESSQLTSQITGAIDWRREGIRNNWNKNSKINAGLGLSVTIIITTTTTTTTTTTITIIIRRRRTYDATEIKTQKPMQHWGWV